MLLDKSLLELSEGLSKGEFTSVDLVAECLSNIDAYNASINAYITVIDRETLLKIAKERDSSMSSKKSMLHGIPFVMKDSYITKDIRTSAASTILKEFVPPYSATVYNRLIEAGAILIGKSNMDAWGHGATNENSDFGPVKNPWDTSRVSGGSTGGVAAAVSARMAAFGIGEDTGGSIRNPASWCNITGLKVTYGRVSRYGCIAYASSFDTVGPMAKSVEDCAVVLEVIAGIDPKDATSSPKEVPQYSKNVQKPNKDTVIGIPVSLFDKGLDPDIKKLIQASIETLKALGYKVKEISMPMIEYGLPVYYLIAPSETSSNLGRYDGIRYGAGRKHFTSESMRRIMIGTYALSSGYYDAYYKKAQQARTLFIKEYEKTFKECDVILMPVTPMQATKLGECIDDPIQNMLLDVYTVTQNPVGVPSLAVPCGFTSDHMPVGFQLTGRMFEEETVFSVAHAYQKNTDWHLQSPPLKEEHHGK